MEAIFQEIWKRAFQYQDKRDDKGHAETVLHFARMFLQKIDADPEVVIPAAILHDIGWSQLPEDDRFFIFQKNIRKKDERASNEEVLARVRHEQEGANLTNEILKDVNYDKEKSKKIIAIILQHDTGKTILSAEDAVVKDADKLWTFTKIGLEADVRRFNYDIVSMINKARKRIYLHGYFNSKYARAIAQEELKDREDELRAYRQSL